MSKVLIKSKICLACPRSCELRPQIEGLPGRKLCPKGLEFLETELEDPKRHYFSTVREPDGQIYAYRTIEPISLQEIENHHQKLKTAENAEARNRIHLEFCGLHKVRKTCIDL